jgi:Bacterial protein of unknown function (DUF899)
VFKQWEAALEELRAKEKAATRARDVLAAERRRLPMVRIERDYVFGARTARRASSTSSNGAVSSSSTTACSAPARASMATLPVWLFNVWGTADPLFA